MNSTDSTISARELTGPAGLSMLPNHFGRVMLAVEAAVYHFMGQLVPAYDGGPWTYLELSNGGCYLVPTMSPTFQLTVDGKGFEGELSADATGITICLFALSHLSFRMPDERIARHFYLLRESALEHAEASQIFAAID